MSDETRRDLIRKGVLLGGAAWTAPVITVGAVAPANATSPPPGGGPGNPPSDQSTVTATQACKVPGKGQEINKGYVLGLTVLNDTEGLVYLQTDDLRIVDGGTAVPLVVQTATCETYALPLGGPVNTLPLGPGLTRLAFYLYENGNSRNTTIELDWRLWSNGSLLTSGTASGALSGDPTTGGCEPHDGWYDTCNIPEGVEAMVAPVP